MWGFNSALDRRVANEIFKRILDRNIASRFNKKNISPKGQDQDFLSNYVYPLVYNRSVVHDSYLCKNYGGSSWPSQRPGNCFVGSPESCNITATNLPDCPLECRPKSHREWTKC